MKVLKFGGSSVANAENIGKVIQIVSRSLHKNQGVIVVVSALGGVTDKLIKTATLASSRDDEYQELLNSLLGQHDEVIKNLIDTTSQKRVLDEAQAKYRELGEALQGIYLLGELSPRSLDKVISFGEQLSSYIISEAMEAKNIHSCFVDSRDMIKTDDAFGSAKVDVNKTYTLIAERFGHLQEVAVMGGFIASTNDGTTTTLGRGGSDYTAALVGAAINAEAIEIWTDVDGVLTADPRKVKGAFPLRQTSYEEAGELAHFGAKVIHPKTMRPAQLENIPIDIKNTFNPEGLGTRISSERSNHGFRISGISSLSNVALLRVQSNNGNTIGEIAARTFDVLARHEIEVLLTTQASHEQSISIAINATQTIKTRSVLEKAFTYELKAKEMPPISVEENLSIIAIVGKQMKGVPGITGKFFGSLGASDISVVAIAQGSSELNISAVINADDELEAVRMIHKEFFDS